jgi:replicative DNA helicase
VEIKKIDSNLEKLIITSMIVSDKFLLTISNIINVSLLKLNYCQIIANWCLDYYKKYNVAPHKNIQNIFESWKQNKNLDQEIIKLVNSFLLHINNNYQREAIFNEQYAIDQSIKYFKQLKLNDLKVKIDEFSKNGQEDEAEKLIYEYKKISIPTHDYTDVFSDLKVVDDILNFEDEELFRYSGELGKVIGPLYRGDLIAFASAAKRGKTFWLIESGIQATLKGLRVAFFSFEMNKQRVLLRIYQNICGETKKEKEIEVPFFEKNDSDRFEIKSVKKEKKGIKSKRVKDKIKAIKQILKGGTLKLFCSGPNSLTINDISTILDNLVINSNFVPDVLIFDYADIIKSNYKSGQHRDNINDKWESLRALCLQKNCLGITVTHTNKKTFDSDIKQGDMSEDIRKINHVAVMIGINQKKTEKARNITRLSLLVNREDDFSTMNEIVVLQCLAIGKPYIDSKLSKDCEEYFSKSYDKK